MQNFSNQRKYWKYIPVLLQLIQLGIYFFLFLQTKDIWRNDRGYCIFLGYLLICISLLQLMVLGQWQKFEKDKEEIPSENTPSISEEEYRRLFAERSCFTSREKEVFERLITSEDGVQEIADGLYISRRNLQRYIASIYEKTGTKSRIGLFQCYVQFRLGEEKV